MLARICLALLVATSTFGGARRAGERPRGLLVGAFGGPGPNSIATYELPSAKRTVLRKSDERGDPYFVSLSPDGAQLAFSYAERRSVTAELRLSRRDGSRERTVVSGLATPVMLWSPDSTLLLIEEETQEHIVDPEANLVWTWHPCSGGGLSRQTALKWTADARGIILWRIFGDEVVLRCDFDGRTQKILTPPPTGVRVSMAMTPGDKRMVMTDSTRLVLVDSGQTQERTLLSVYDLDNDILFLSPDGKWAGIVGRFNFTKDERQFVLLTNVEDGALRTLKLPHTRGIQWWTPSAASNLDARAIVRAALGPGKPFTPPLVLAPPQ